MVISGICLVPHNVLEFKMSHSKFTTVIFAFGKEGVI